MAGGQVVLVKDTMRIGFSTLNERYDLKCSWSEARNLKNDLLDAHSDMSEAAVDELCKKEFKSRGWN